MKIAVINGANLNFVGIREPHIYGMDTLPEINKQIEAEAKEIAEINLVNLDLTFFQSNIEGEIINFIQKCQLDMFDGVIINPGAFAHYSYAIRDAVASIAPPCIEVHMSNPSAREEFRRNSVVTPACIGQVSGFRSHGYVMAIYALIKIKLSALGHGGI